MSIEALMQIVQPPAVPVGGGNPELWTEFERITGLSFPDDYKAFCHWYGKGDFWDFVVIFTPFTVDKTGVYLEKPLAEIESLLETYRHHKKLFPETCPYPMYPDQSGLFPFGTSTNGDTIFWLTKGEPSSWPIVVAATDNEEFEQYDMSLTEFLVAFLADALPGCFFGGWHGPKKGKVMYEPVRLRL